MKLINKILGKNTIVKGIKMIVFVTEKLSRSDKFSTNQTFDDDYRTSAWCIDKCCSIICGVNIVSIGSDALNPTYCKLAGIYSILRIIKCMVDYYQISNGSVYIGCDYEGGLKNKLL